MKDWFGKKAPRLFSFGAYFCFQPFAARQNTRVALIFGPEKLKFRAVLILRIKISVGVANAEGDFLAGRRHVGVVVGAAKTHTPQTFNLNLGFCATVPILARMEGDGACKTFVRQSAQRLFAKPRRVGKRRLPKTQEQKNMALGQDI